MVPQNPSMPGPVTGTLTNEVPLNAMLGTAAFGSAQWFAPGETTVVPTTGQTQTISPTSYTYTLKLKPAGTLATQTLSFANIATAQDGQEVAVYSSQNITAITMSGANFDGPAITTIPAGQTVFFQYGASDQYWTNITPSPTLYAASSSGTPGTPTVTAHQGQVAIGDGATVSSTGTGDIAIGTGATAAGTVNNSMALGNSYASGADSFAAANADHSGSYGAQGANSIAIGKQAKAASTNSAAVGQNCVASSSNAHASGYCANGSSSGQWVWASGLRSATGDAQTSIFVLRGTTTNASATTVYTDGSSTQITLPASQALSYHVQAVCHDTTTVANNATITSVQPGLVYNNAGTLANQAPTFGAVVALNSWTVTGMAVTCSASGANLQIQVQGPTGTTDTIHWVVVVRTAEVTA